MSNKRKAWNEAMLSAAGSAALPKALQPRTQKRRSDRRKKQDRRDKARKTSVLQSSESKEFRAATWMDALEDVPLGGGGGDGEGADGGDGDDSYDELDELEGAKKKKARGGRGKSKATKKQQGNSLPKRFKARSMANTLLEEVNRDDGVAFAWLEDEARSLPHRTSNNNNDNDNNKNSRTVKLPRMPARKFCPVTGMAGIYTEPKSGLPFANLKALEQVRERPPPWMTLAGSIAYHEAVKSIRDEAEQQDDDGS